MRKIVLITTTNCPRCGYIKRTVFDAVKAACPGQCYTVNGSAAPAFVKQYGIKGAPSFLFLEDEEKAGLVYKTFETEKMIRWLKGAKYNDQSKNI